MMTVKIYLDKSTIHGIGAFASEDIKKGQLVWKFVDGLDSYFTHEHFQSLPEIAKDYIKRYGYLSLLHDEHWVMDYDHGRFMNHSDEPNVDFSNKEAGYAARDIKKGEELTCKYSEFCNNFATEGWL